MKIIKKQLLTIILSIGTSSSTFAQAGKLEALSKLQVKTSVALNTLKASGLGDSHPKMLELTRTMAVLDLEIENTKDLHQEIIILIDGTKSNYLEGHARHGKTDSALTELLNAGWKIEQIIQAESHHKAAKITVDNKLKNAAFVWLSFEG